MKVLVTGATGFLGKYLIQELVENNYQVLAVGRNQLVGNSLVRDSVEFKKVDFEDVESLSAVVKESDYIIHAGGLSTVWGDFNLFYKANVISTKNIVDASLKSNIKKLVYVSSPSIYTDKRDRYNIREEEVNNFNNLNNYIKSKILAENEVNIGYKKGLKTIIIRPRGLIGIGDTSIIPRVLKINEKIGVPLLNGGENIVDMTCVENVALALRLALECDKSGEVYNITNGEPMKFKEILEYLFKAIEKEPKYLKINSNFLYNASALLEFAYSKFNLKKEPPLTKYMVLTLAYSQTLNIDKAKKELDYKPKLLIKEGLDRYAKDYKKNNLL